MLISALTGFTFLLGLIVAIGAQNAFVLRQGLRREHVGVVIAICAGSDAVLIVVGVAGVGGAIASNQTLLSIVTALGAAVLLGYAALAAKRALRPGALETDRADDGAAPLDAAGSTSEDRTQGAAAGASTPDGSPTGPGAAATGQSAASATLTRTRPQRAGAAQTTALGAVVLSALALTWLNPHVYLDTVVLLGSVAASYPAPWLFALGAALGSVAWFAALGFGARLLAPLFAKPRAWQVFDGVIAVVMAAMAIGLLLGLSA